MLNFQDLLWKKNVKYLTDNFYIGCTLNGNTLAILGKMHY